MTELLERAGTEAHPITVERAAGTIRLFAGDELIAESDKALILREAAYPPMIYMPKDAMRHPLVPHAKMTHCPYKGNANHWSLDLPDGRHVEIAAFSYDAPIEGIASIAEHLGFYTNHIPDARFDPGAETFRAKAS